MNTPIPTPFDIIDPRPGALVPTGLAWIALAACSLGVLGYISFRRRTPGAHSMQATLRVLIDELRAAAAQCSDTGEMGHNFELVTRLIRRVLTPYVSKELATMSCSELRSASSTLLQSSNKADVSLAPLLSQLATLEEHSYAPQTSSKELAGLQQLQSKLIDEIESHVRRFRPS